MLQPTTGHVAQNQMRLGVDLLNYQCIAKHSSYVAVTKTCLRKLSDHLPVTLFDTLASILTPLIDFSIVPVSNERSQQIERFAYNLTDIELSTWDMTANRLQVLQFLPPLYYYKYAFIVSTDLLETHGRFINIAPFDYQTIFGILASLALLIIFETFCLNFTTAERKSWLYRLCEAMKDYSDLSGLTNRALTQRLIGFPAAVAQIFVISIVVRYGFCCFVAATLIFKRQLPFTRIAELLKLVEQQRIKLLTLDDSFVELMNATTQGSTLLRHATYITSDEDIIKSGLKAIVFPTDDFDGPDYVETVGCDKLHMIIVSDMIERSYTYPLSKEFRNKTILELFGRAVAETQPYMQRLAEKQRTHITCQQVNDKVYSLNLKLKQFQELYTIYGCVILASTLIFIVEVSYWGR